MLGKENKEQLEENNMSNDVYYEVDLNDLRKAVMADEEEVEVDLDEVFHGLCAIYPKLLCVIFEVILRQQRDERRGSHC